MIFDLPAGWLTSLLVLLLLFLSFFRRRPPVVEVPSVLLWMRIPPRPPPLRQLRAPRLSWLFWVQAGTLLCLTAGLAGPYLVRRLPGPSIVYVVDPRPTLPTRLRQGATRWDRIRQETGPLGIAWTDEDPDPVEVVLRARATAVPGALLVWVSDRPPPEGWQPDGEIVVADDAPNLGIVEARVDGDHLRAVVHNHGPPVIGHVGGRPVRFRTGRTLLTAPAVGPAVTLEIDIEDALDLDDRVTFRRVGRAVRVAVGGPIVPALQRVLAALDATMVPPDEADLRIVTTPDRTTEFVPRSFATAGDPILENVLPDELGAPLAWEVPGKALIWADGRPVVAVDGRTVRVGLELAGSIWASTPSFPIFWKNVMECATEGSGVRWVRFSGSPLDPQVTDARGTMRIRLPERAEGGIPTRQPLAGWAAAGALAGLLTLTALGSREV